MSVSEFLQSRLTALKWTGRALRYRNYRLFFIGQGISLIGTWMQRTALQWFVLVLTGSTVIMGTLDFSSQIPALLIAPLAGLAADHFSRRQVVILTQIAAAVQASILATLVLTHHVHVWHLYALAVFLGLVNGFDIPARQSFVVEMVEDKSALGNAIALNSTVFNGARLIGPPVGAVILDLIGAGLCFLLNAVSFIAVIWALLAMRLKPQPREVTARPGMAGLREGFGYAWRFKPIRYLLLNLSFVGLAGSPYMMLLPVFARNVLHSGPRAFGLMTAAVGVGAVVGATFLASRKNERGLARLIGSAMVLYSISLIAFSRSTYLPLSLFILLFTGLGMMMMMAGTNTLIQALVDDDKRGRVMSIYTMTFMGAGPIGSLWAGIAAKHIGAPLTVWIGGSACLIAACAFLVGLSRVQAARLHSLAQPNGGTPEQ